MLLKTHRVRLVTAFLLILALVPAQLMLGARSSKPGSIVTLKRKRSQVNSNIRKAQLLIRQKKNEQKYAQLSLEATQRKLETAQDSVTGNKIRLAKSKSDLDDIKRRLARNQKQLLRRGKLLSRRLVDIYQGDDIGYIDVVLGSRDMRTFASRGYYVRQIVSSDVNLIKDYKKMRDDIEQDKKQQAAEVRRIAAIQSQLIEQRDEVSALESNQQARIHDIENDRAKYEQMLAEFVAESERIGDAIRQMQATPEGQRRYARKFTGALGLPVNGRITCRFGYRIHPITRVHSLHTGVDIACPTGTPVHCAAAGKVLLARWNRAYGWMVVVDHGGGVTTLYGHNSKLLVRPGQDVSRGQVLSLSGSTGYSTGPHVHFERQKDGRAMNPL